MESDKKKLLQQRREALQRAAPEVEKLFVVLTRAGLELSHLDMIRRNTRIENPRRSWLARWRVDQRLRERFELAPEVLMLIAPWNETQARDIEEAERTLRSDLKCDRGLVLALSFDDDMEHRLLAAMSETHRTWVVLDRRALANARAPADWIIQTLAQRLGVRDLFGATSPVAGWDFFGRERDLAELRRTLLGGRAVCVYGLGKVGKSSLLKRLRADWITQSQQDQTASHRPGPKVVAIHVDLQAVGGVERNQAGVMRQLLAATVDTLDEMGVNLSAAGLRQRHRAWEVVASMPAMEVCKVTLDGLKSLVRHVGAEGGAVVVIFDEYERLYGADRGLPPSEGVAVLDTMRGLLQQSPGRFAFVVAGRSREHAQRARIDGEVNPLYNFAGPFPLAGLPRHELGILVERIGRRAGVVFSSDAVDLVYEESGGHPYLARQYCRIVERLVPVEDRRPFAASREATLRRLGEFRREARWTMDELLHAVQRFDEETPAYLSALLTGDEPRGRDGTPWRPDVVDELVAIGVLARSGDERPTMRIKAFGAWLAANWRPMETARAAG